MVSSIVAHWRRLCGTVHPDDEPYFRALKHSFNLDYPPPAYVGDVENAPVVILLANGGYDKKKTPREFDTTERVERFIEHLHKPGPIDPTKLTSYWQPLEPLIKSGKACVVNACAYRSTAISCERNNQRLCDLLPSVHVHRRWLITELLPQTQCGTRLIIAHRWGLWRISPREDFGENVKFSRSARGKHLSSAMLSLAKSWEPMAEAPNCHGA